MTDANTLTPCPFCGERAETYFIPERHSYQIECSDVFGCTARVTRDSEEAAIEAWNLRAPAPAPAPTDADIIALADETRTGEPGREGYILPISFARAVLAKWGTPAPVSQPVAAPSGPLTDSQIADIYFEALGQHLREQDRKMVMRFARAIEQAHGIKATNQESNK